MYSYFSLVEGTDGGICLRSDVGGFPTCSGQQGCSGSWVVNVEVVLLIDVVNDGHHHELLNA